MIKYYQYSKPMFMVIWMRDNYNKIANLYNQLVDSDVKECTFPYAGYGVIQDILTDELCKHKKIIKVLDLGCGTAKIYQHINPEKIDFVGIDASFEMIELARKRFPKGRFFQHDILKGLPDKISNESFDYIIINYLFMHFSFRTSLDLIHLMLKKMNKLGKILVGDLLFMNPQAKQEFFYQHQDFVDLDIHFHLYSQFVNKMSEQLALSFFEINDYTGLMVIENINDIPLLFEEPLVKYKSNTKKCRSTHPQKKRE